MKNFKKQVIKVDLKKIENLKKEFNNLASMVTSFKNEINQYLDSTYGIAEALALVENPNQLSEIFKQLQISAIKQRANDVGVTLSELEQLENIELNKMQMDLLVKAKNLKSSNLFSNGMSSKDWLVDGSIVITPEVEEAITEACTLYTKNELENSRLAVLKQYRKHLELDKYDKTVILKILGNNDPESFIGYQSR